MYAEFINGRVKGGAISRCLKGVAARVQELANGTTGILSIVGMLAVYGGGLQADEFDWYCWRGAQQTGRSAESQWTHEWAEGPNIAWTAHVGTGFSSCVVSEGSVFTLGHSDEQDHIYCLNVESGQTQWKFSYAATLDDRDFEGGPTSTPTVDQGRLYVLSRAGMLFCLDAYSGRLNWQVQLAEAAKVRLPGWGFSAAPVIVGDKVLVGVGEFGAALNKMDGKILWSSADREAGYGSPVLLPNSVPPTAIMASSRSYIAVDIETGHELWRERWLTTFGCNAADAVLNDDQVFLSSGYNRGAAVFKLVDGKPHELWKNKEMQNQLHSSILYEQSLYGIDGNMEAGGRLRCMDWATGKVCWSEDVLHPGGLTMAGDRLIVLTDQGELVIAKVTPAGFEELARGRAIDGKCWTVPVLSNGRIFCRSVDGQVACVDVRG